MARGANDGNGRATAIVYACVHECPLSGADRTLWFRPPNITPRANSALMKFPDRATFVARFKVGGRHYDGSPMPWEAFSRMAPEDVGALYEFLHAQRSSGSPAPEDPRVRQGPVAGN